MNIKCKSTNKISHSYIVDWVNVEKYNNTVINIVLYHMIVTPIHVFGICQVGNMYPVYSTLDMYTMQCGQ